MVNLIAAILALTAELSVQQLMPTNPRLHRNNQMKMIHASLAIENNSLTLEQVTALFQGK